MAPDASLISRRFELFNLTSELLIGDFLFSVRFFELLYSLIQLFVLFLCPVAGLRAKRMAQQKRTRKTPMMIPKNTAVVSFIMNSFLRLP